MSAQDQDPKARERVLMARSRVVSLVIAGAMVLWLLSLWFVPAFGLPVRYSFLFDFAALAALFWGFVVSLQLKRARKAARAES
jgi:hypothetical protein